MEIDRGTALEYAKNKLKEKIDTLVFAGLTYEARLSSFDFKVQNFDIEKLSDKDVKAILKIQEEKLNMKKKELEKLYTICDAIFFDFKKYKVLKDALVDASPCYAITELNDLVKRHTTGKSRFNFKYKVRKNNFNNIKCV